MAHAKYVQIKRRIFWEIKDNFGEWWPIKRTKINQMKTKNTFDHLHGKYTYTLFSLLQYVNDTKVLKRRNQSSTVIILCLSYFWFFVPAFVVLFDLNSCSYNTISAISMSSSVAFRFIIIILKKVFVSVFNI